MAYSQRVYDETPESDFRLGQPPVLYTPTGREVRHKHERYGKDDRMTVIQIDFLKAVGVTPHHRVVEIGPGGLRLANHLLPYLDAGNYACIEPSRLALDAGWTMMDEPSKQRAPLLLWGGDFSLAPLPWKADFAWAHSVFTHLPWNEIGKCLHETRKAIAEGGMFFATYLRCNGDPWKPQPYGKPRPDNPKVSYGDRDPYHYEFDVIQDLARRTGWVVEHRDWSDHPKSQSMLALRPC